MQVQNGNPGDIDGRMVYYKPTFPFFNSANTQFAFSKPFISGLTGNQFVFFNTYQPSLNFEDADNFVTNWVQLTNLENTPQAGTLTYFSQAGIILGQENINIDPGARRDFAGHQFGRNLVGMIQWSPNSLASKFQMRNVRYYYDNPLLSNSFDSAFQLEARRGSGSVLIAPVDTRSATSVVEIGNTLNIQASINVKIYSKTGSLVYNQNHNLPSKGSHHIIVDPILVNDLGIVMVEGPTASSALATVMQYGRTPSAGINYIYGIEAKEALGTVIRGSYNTYLEQACSLLIASRQNQNVSISAVRSSGEVVIAGQTLSINENGISEFNLCEAEESDFYGVVTVQPDNVNTIFSQVIRKANGNTYQFPTPVRQ
jgi:hypothetical protein